MKKFLLISNLVLIAAVAILFVLFFNNDHAVSTGNVEDSVQNDTNALDTLQSIRVESNVVYVNTDSVFARYDMMDEVEDQLTAEQLKLEGQLDAEYKKFEETYKMYQDQAQYITSQDQARQWQEELKQKEQALYQKEDALKSSLGKKQADLNNKVTEKIFDYLKRYNEKNGYFLILSQNMAGGVLAAANGLDITNEVIDGLNAEYQADQAKEMAQDSTGE